MRALWAIGLIAAIGAAAPITATSQTDAPAEKVEKVGAQTTEPELGESTDDILDLDVEDLLSVDVVVTSVKKAPTKVRQSPAAVFVLTQEDIRRAGVRSIADALRLVPGVHVAGINASTTAITIRGFNGQFANKLLVLIDGRSVYTPLFSGVFWDVQDPFLADIDRIEVIRGPGATLWGANAVNGVINIITKSAKETQGGIAVAGAGTYQRAFGGVRYGGPIGENAHFRLFAQFFERDRGRPAAASDDWRQHRVGFRVDWAPSKSTDVMVHTEAYDGVAGLRLTVPQARAPFARSVISDSEASGGYVLGRLTHRFSQASEIAAQLYYDRTNRDVPGLLEEERDTIDLDLQHRFRASDRHDLTWGLRYRVTADDISASASLFYPDLDETHFLVSGFIQDEITLVPDKLQLILGTKLEYNDFTGFEFQPSGRLSWTIDDTHYLWGAVSRAVRTPSRSADSVRIVQPPSPGPLPGSAVFPAVLGSSDFRSEDLLAFEIGYRVRPASRLSFDATAFWHDYDDLQTLEPGTPQPIPGLPLGSAIVPVTFDNRMQGHVWGFELSAEWQPFSWWRLVGTHALTRISLDPDTGSGDTQHRLTEDRSPRHTASLRSLLDLSDRWQLDSVVRAVDRLRNTGIHSYVELDLRLAWDISDSVTAELVGRNLLDRSHQEFTSDLIRMQGSEVERSVFGMLTVRW